MNEPSASSCLVGHRNGIFQVAEQNVDIRDGVGKLGHHFFNLWREEVNDTTGAERNLAYGLGSTNGERFEEVFSTTHGLIVGLLTAHCEVRQADSGNS